MIWKIVPSPLPAEVVVEVRPKSSPVAGT